MVEGGPGGFDPEAENDKQQGADAPQPIPKPESIRPGQNVVVRRSSGEIEPGWIVTNYFYAAGKVEVTKPDPDNPGKFLVNNIPRDEFLKLNPDLGVESEQSRTPDSTDSEQTPKDSPAPEAEETPETIYPSGRMEARSYKWDGVHEWEGVVVGERILVYKETYPDEILFGVNDQATSVHYGTFRSEVAAKRAGERIAQIEGIDTYDPWDWFVSEPNRSPESNELSAKIRSILDEELASDIPDPTSSLPDNPPDGRPVEAPPDNATAPDTDDPDWRKPSIFDQPEEDSRESYSPGDERDVTLRHAVSYLFGADRERLMEEHKGKGATKVIKRKIKDLDRINYIAHEGDEWKKLFKPDKYEWIKRQIGFGIKPKAGRTEAEFSKKERKRLEEVARYKEVYRYRDEARKLMKEAQVATPERKTEIERELDGYYAMLMKLAHEDSYKVEVELTDKARYAKVKRKRDESQESYRSRANKKLPGYVKDIKVKPRGDGDDPSQLRSQRPIPRDEGSTQQWARDMLEGEQKGKFRSGVEGPIKKVESKLGDPVLADNLILTYKLLSKYKEADLKKLGIEIKCEKSRIVYTEPGGGKKKKGVEAIKPKLASPTYSITIKAREGEYHVFTIYSDGCNEDGKRVERPTKKGEIVENVSVRHTVVKYRYDGGHEPTRTSINPPLDNEGLVAGITTLSSLEARVEKELAPKSETEIDKEAEVVPPDNNEIDDVDDNSEVDDI
ncbi:MAG: hypothetical protein Q7K33_03655 [Candidatus Berkelbacteria bacterium]|nr:hypothetical protein [Candidatus Berkelbacteria bacterium]